MSDRTGFSGQRLNCQHSDGGVPLKALAAEEGNSPRSVGKWLTRFPDGKVAAMAGLRSGHRTQRRTLELQQAVDLQHKPCTLRHSASALEALFSNFRRLMNGWG